MEAEGQSECEDQTGNQTWTLRVKNSIFRSRTLKGKSLVDLRSNMGVQVRVLYTNFRVDLRVMMALSWRSPSRGSWGTWFPGWAWDCRYEDRQAEIGAPRKQGPESKEIQRWTQCRGNETWLSREGKSGLLWWACEYIYAEKPDCEKVKGGDSVKNNQINKCQPNKES